jgi:cytochrome c6
MVGIGILASLLLLVCLVAPAAWAADPQKGGRLYTKNCKDCHGADGVAQMPGVPEFRRGEGLLRSDDDLLQFIRNGSGMMPAYRGLLSDRDILDVIAYLRTLRR